MSSGAYALFIDQQAGGGPAGALRQVVPLPPPEQSGAVKFTTVVLSLAYDTFGEGRRTRDNPCDRESLAGQRDSRHHQRNG